MSGSHRRLTVALAAVVVVLALGIPALGAPPQPVEPPGRAAKPAKPPEQPVTVTGEVAATTDAGGMTTFRLTADGRTWTLSAGPPWFWGADNPLAALVGRTVTIAGTTREGSDELDVETVDGDPLREPGKPPWAGGPWVIGPTHPGWKPWMADGKPGRGAGNGHGREGAPGRSKRAAP